MIGNKRVIILLFLASVNMSLLVGCRLLSIKGFTNLQRIKHVVNSSYPRDTLHLNKALYWPIFFDRTLYNPEKGGNGLYYSDTIVPLDSISVYLIEGLKSTGVPVIFSNLENKSDERYKTILNRNMFKYNIVPDKDIISLAHSNDNNISFIPIVIRRTNISRSDFGITYSIIYHIKVCLIENSKVIYSKYFMKFKDSDIFTLDDAKDYESTREFFELNNHTPEFTQEDWNRIMAFAMKGYLKRLKK